MAKPIKATPVLSEQNYDKLCEDIGLPQRRRKMPNDFIIWSCRVFIFIVLGCLVTYLILHNAKP
jgi:hypothetical protein